MQAVKEIILFSVFARRIVATPTLSLSLSSLCPLPSLLAFSSFFFFSFLFFFLQTMTARLKPAQELLANWRTIEVRCREAYSDVKEWLAPPLSLRRSDALTAKVHYVTAIVQLTHMYVTRNYANTDLCLPVCPSVGLSVRLSVYREVSKRGAFCSVSLRAAKDRMTWRGQEREMQQKEKQWKNIHFCKVHKFIGKGKQRTSNDCRVVGCMSRTLLEKVSKHVNSWVQKKTCANFMLKSIGKDTYTRLFQTLLQLVDKWNCQ